MEPLFRRLLNGCSARGEQTEQILVLANSADLTEPAGRPRPSLPFPMASLG